MSTEAVNRIIKEVQALTPAERRELIDRLAQEGKKPLEHVVRRPGTLKGTGRSVRSFNRSPGNRRTSLNHQRRQ